jgi:hypothetical protein
MQAYRGSKVITPLILNVGTCWREVVGCRPQPLYLRDGTPKFIEWEAGLASESVWKYREKFLPDCVSAVVNLHTYYFFHFIIIIIIINIIVITPVHVLFFPFISLHFLFLPYLLLNLQLRTSRKSAVFFHAL